MANGEKFDRGGAAEALQGLRILTAPPPRPTARRPYQPKPPPVPGLVEAVWDSYQTGQYKLIPIPAEHVDLLRSCLLQAKNYLNYQHGTDIRGLDKKDIEVIDRELVIDADIRKLIPKGMLAVRFIARKPMNKGMRARQARLANLAARGARRSDQIAKHAQGRSLSRPAVATGLMTGWELH